VPGDIIEPILGVAANCSSVQIVNGGVVDDREELKKKGPPHQRPFRVNNRRAI
jgi:hypothetical protein